MTFKFVTLFNSFYLARGIVMAESLLRAMPAAKLFVVCMDSDTCKVIGELGIENIVAVSREDFENEELLSVKPHRNTAEYCWTCTPASLKYVFEKYPEVELLTYLDADLFFFSDPAAIFKELENSSVLITAHRFRKNKKYMEEMNGIYNVQYMSFRRNADGLKVLNWWYDKCIEWCYDRHEAERYGDQKYLDKWPEIFDGVKILKNIATCLAPWNLLTHTLSCHNGRVMVDAETPLVFYHFQSLKIFSEKIFNMTVDYRLRKKDRELIYLPYLRELQKTIIRLKKEYPLLNPGVARMESRRGFLNSLKIIKRKLLLKDNYFIL